MKARNLKILVLFYTLVFFFFLVLLTSSFILCSKTYKIYITNVEKCKYCGKIIKEYTDTLTTHSRSYQDLKKFLKKSYYWLADKIYEQLKKNNVAKVTQFYDLMCDSCGNIDTIIETGTIYKCRFCGKEYKKEISRKKIKRKDMPLFILHTQKKVCGSKLCRLREKHPDWDEEICRLILQGKIRLGMTKEQVIASWGKPERVNRSVGTWGIHEQWVYGTFGPYLYFENGILTSWQD